MTNTTDTYWSVDGVSLQTFANNITTLSGRDTPPPMRGEDLTVPYSPGQTWVPKVVDSRVISLNMWVRGSNADGSIPTNRANSYDDNWRALRNLLWTPGRQFVLTKRFKVGGVLKVVTAMGEYAGGLSSEMMGRYAGKFAVDIKLADPYFYDENYSSFPLVNGDQNITLPGDAESNRVLLTINGARTNAKLRNNTLGVEMEHRNVLLSGGLTDIDVKQYRATTIASAGGTAFKSTGMIRHTGAPQWFAMKPGINSVTYSSTSGAGSTILQAKGAWL